LNDHDHETLGSPPRIDVVVVEDHTESARCDRGFLRLRRLVLQNRYADGTKSAPYPYDLVERDAIDAVAIVLWMRDGDAVRVCLRTALRPPMTFRPGYALPIPEEAGAGVLWEIPAGLVEPDEHGPEGLAACAARETMEEVGLDVSPSEFETLGPPAGLSPGVIGEKIHFLAAEVEPRRAEARGAPTEDGSPVEEKAEVCFLPLSDALIAARAGEIGDLKTEVGIRRLAERLEERAG
jgi:ADP-ribose pyrophosphatase